MKTDVIASPVFVAGHRGMVGAAVCRRLSKEPGVALLTRARDELDLCDDDAVARFVEKERPATVIFAAAKVGGIHANQSFPVEFFTDNLRQELSTIHASYRFGVQRFLFLGSTCIYPRLAKQPISEDQLLAGPLEPTNEAYALAKIAGLKGLDPKDVLSRYDSETRLKGLDSETRLKGLDPEIIEAYLKKLKKRKTN